MGVKGRDCGECGGWGWGVAGVVREAGAGDRDSGRGLKREQNHLPMDLVTCSISKPGLSVSGTATKLRFR